jgi:Domain of unknown function (DUF222)/HNH endonuclease
MTPIRDSLQQLTVLLADVARVDRATLTNSDLVAVLDAEAAAGRLLETSQVLTAAEVAERSRYELGAAGLSMTYSHRRPVDLVEHRTRVSKSEAARRIRVGSAIRPRQTLIGELLPPERPILAEAMTAGLVGIDAAQAIISSLKQAAQGCEATLENMDAAELSLVELAAANPADDVADAGRAWRDALDPDGIEPRYADIVAKRLVVVGRERNGITPFTVNAPPPLTAVFNAALADSMDPGVGPRFLSDEDRARATIELVDRDGEQVERLVDPRTLGQKQFDILEAVFTAGLAATREGRADHRTIGTVTAVISLKDLIAGTGFGILEGIEEIIPTKVIQQLVCDTGFDPVVVGNLGQPLYHGTKVRYITPVQRRSLIVRDGDRCVAKGCRKHATHTHGHHVVFAGQGGPTDIDNLVLLCPAHHAALHQGAFQIRMINGMPYMRDSIDAMNDHAWTPASHNRITLTNA